MNCSICGYEVRRVGAAQSVCKYEKATGRFNFGRATHANCAHKHWDAHYNANNPRSIVSIGRSIRKAEGGEA